MAPRLHLVDGTFELYRAHFAKRPDHAAKDGSDAKATLGVVGSMRVLLRDASEQATHVAVAFDNPIRSFRNDLFPPYKSDEGVPPELRAQFDLVEEAVRAIGITVWSMREWEADDALATAVKRFHASVSVVRVLTPDKDLGQCLAFPNVVLVDRIRKKETDRAAFVERRGIQPESLPDFLALTGDAADGFPGLPGFGEKTAAAVLARFGTIEAIPLDARAWPSVRGADKLVETLAARRDDALLYKRLATLVTDVPLAESLDDLRVKALDAAALADLAARLDAPELVG